MKDILLKLECLRVEFEDGYCPYSYFCGYLDALYENKLIDKLLLLEYRLKIGYTE